MMIPSILDELLDRAFEEDLAGGDLTTEACVRPDARATATAVARKPLVVCGGEVYLRAFRRIDPEVQTQVLIADGVFVEKGAAIWRATGAARSLLMAERTALNFAQRMSGIATAARTYASAVAPGSRTRVTDTRKTTPGLRVLERYAVRTGGAYNHRDDLGSAVMIKDNHIVAAGGIAAAVERARARAPHTSRVEVEVANFAELDQALAAGADIIMLDNFSVEDVRKAVALVHQRPARPILEASGGITLERIRELSEAGVDIISVGALTHSAPAADIALDLALEQPWTSS
jgi:nicotinate-nucleotide pyrophosphorylase (carboxylating)